MPNANCPVGMLSALVSEEFVFPLVFGKRTGRNWSKLTTFAFGGFMVRTPCADSSVYSGQLSQRISNASFSRTETSSWAQHTQCIRFYVQENLGHHAAILFQNMCAGE